MGQPLLSFIIPVHNGEGTIAKCLDSTFCLGFDFEVLVIDDGSDDNTVSVLQNIEDPHLKIIRKAKGGAASARNYGIRLAEGRYVAFLDSDDWIRRDAYCEIGREIAREETDIILVNASKVFPNGIRKDLGNGYQTAFGQNRIYGSDIRQRASRLRKMPAAPWDKIIRREFAAMHPFPEGRFVEDLDWTMRLFADAQSVRYLAVDAYAYCQSESSTSRQRGARFLSDYLWFFDQWVGFEGDQASKAMVNRFLTTQMYVFLGIYGQAEADVSNQLIEDVERLFAAIYEISIPLRYEEKIAFVIAKKLGVRFTSKLLATALSLRTKIEQSRRIDFCL